jgi:hypothetical protein
MSILSHLKVPLPTSGIRVYIVDMYLAALFIELFGLYVLAGKLSEAIYIFFYLITRSRMTTITILTIILFPGTVLHELSHLFTAGILGVPAGRLTLTPDLPDNPSHKFHSESLQMGSVSIAHTDPLRRYLIGFSPIVWGTIALSALSYIFLPMLVAAFTKFQQDLTPDWMQIAIQIVVFYLLVVISMSMFSSREDLKGIVAFLVAFLAVGIVLFIAGFRIDLSATRINPILNRAIESFAYTIGLILLTDILIFLFLKISRKIMERAMGVRLVRT